MYGSQKSWNKNNVFHVFCSVGQLDFNVQENFQTYNLPIANFKRSSFFISKKIIPEKITSIGIVAFGRDHKADLNIKRIEFIE